MTGIDRTTLGGARDAAFILVGYAGALRIGELAALALEDIESRPDGIVLRIRRSKTDRNTAGAKVAVARGKHPDTDPIAALQHWLQLRGTTPGPVLIPLRGGATRGTRARTPHLRSTAQSTRETKPASPTPNGSAATRSALDTPPRPTAPASRSRVSSRRPGTRTVSVLFDRYIRPVDALQFSSSKDLGL